MDDIRECYQILDVEPGASLEEITRSHRELTKVWHPDRFRAEPGLQAKALAKFKQINIAYQRLCIEVPAAARPEVAGCVRQVQQMRVMEGEADED